MGIYEKALNVQINPNRIEEEEVIRPAQAPQSRSRYIDNLENPVYLYNNIPWPHNAFGKWLAAQQYTQNARDYVFPQPAPRNSNQNGGNLGRPNGRKVR